MEVKVTGKHLEITPAIRDYGTDKAAKLTRYFDRVTSIEVVADKGENHHYDVEVIVHVERRDPFIARTRHEDLYAGIDETISKMERQLTDHKSKLRNRKHPAT